MDEVLGDELNFPNPFGKTLCVPHYLFLPLRLVIQGCIYTAYLAFLVWKNTYKRLLRKRSDLITWQNEESVRRKNNTKSTSNSTKEKEFRALFEQSEQSVKKQVSDVLSIYIDSDVVINELIIDSVEWHESSFIVMKKAINSEMTKYNNRYILGDRLEWTWMIWSIMMHVCMLAAILFKFSQAFFTENNKNNKNDNDYVRIFNEASGWQIYQGLFTSLILYLPGLPLSNLIWLIIYYHLSDLLIQPNNWINQRFPQLKMMVNRSTFYKTNPLIKWLLWFKFFFAYGCVFPWIITHMLPSYFIDNLWNKDENNHWDPTFIAACIIVFEICLQMTSVACVIFYSGQGWITGFTASLSGTYCSNGDYPSNWITFNPSNFQWPEMVILLGWVLA